jgi:ferredoxin
MTDDTAPAAAIEVDLGKCIGAGNCVDVAPGHFDQDSETGLVIVLEESVSAGEVTTVQEAADLCPVAAIRLRRAAQGA